MRLKNLDLIVTLIIVVLNVIWVLLPSHLPVIGIILSLPLVFVLPGYTLTEALFRKRLLETSHRLVLPGETITYAARGCAHPKLS